jgi:cobaltochelatase CobS
MLTVLTSTTAVPTFCRGALRAFIRGQKGFAQWCADRNIPSHNVKNGDLIEYALAHGLDQEVLAIINQTSLAGAMTAAHDNFVSVDDNDFDREMGAIIDAAVQEETLSGVPALPVIRNWNAIDVDRKAQEAINVSNRKASLSHALATVLAPVEPFLSPLVRQELEKALQPLIDAANKPAIEIERIVEIEKIVEREVAALAPLAQGALPYATKGSQIEIGKLFGFKGQYAKSPVSLWEAHGAAPPVDPHYVVDSAHMHALGTAIERGSNVWLAGPSGTGKSTMPEQFAAYTGRPCTVIGFTRQTEVADMVGGPALMSDGSSQWVDGVLIQAVKRPGMVIILDEISIAPAGVLMVLQRLASDARAYTLPTGEVVHCAPGVVFCAADNTRGTGDETGAYHGTNAVNAALIDRFKRMLVVDYMSKSDEAKAIVNHCPSCPKPAADALADFVARARKLPEMENIVLSLRQMVGFVQAIQDGMSVKVASQVTILNRVPATERAALETLFTLAWASDFTNLMSGTAIDVNASPAPVSAAGQAFDDEISASLSR